MFFTILHYYSLRILNRTKKGRTLSDDHSVHFFRKKNFLKNFKNMADSDNKEALIRLEEAQELVTTMSGAEFTDILEVVFNKMSGSSATGKYQTLLAAFTREQTDCT